MSRSFDRWEIRVGGDEPTEIIRNGEDITFALTELRVDLSHRELTHIYATFITSGAS